MKPELIIKAKRKGTTNPRFRILPNGQGILAGISYRDLQSLVCGASIHFYESLRKTQRDSEDNRWHLEMIYIVDRLRESLHGEFDKTFPPKLPQPKTAKVLIAKFKEYKKEREILNNLIKAALKEARQNIK